MAAANEQMKKLVDPTPLEQLAHVKKASCLLCRNLQPSKRNEPLKQLQSSGPHQGKYHSLVLQWREERERGIVDPTSHVVPLLLYSFAHTTKKPSLCALQEQKLWINAVARMQHKIDLSVTYTHAIQWRNPVRLPPLTRETRPPR